VRQIFLGTDLRDVHLSHELVVKVFLEVCVGERSERLEHGVPRRTDDTVHLADDRERCCRPDWRWWSQERPSHGGARRRCRLRPASSLHCQRRVGCRANWEGPARRSR